MDPISAVIGLVTSVVSKIWPDKTEQEKEAFTLELTRELNQSQLLTKQIDVDQAEAANPNLFVSGGRPFIIWVCGFSFAWTYLFQPMITYFCIVCGHPVPPMPALDNATMSSVLMGLLGLSGMRSWEKYQGVNNRHG